MGDAAHTAEIVKVVMLCVVWYGISSGNNVVGKVVLNSFPYPLTVTMVQLFSITVYSGPVFALWGIRPYLDLEWGAYMRCIVPWLKATMPLFTVVLSRIILKEKQTCMVYMSLLPIIVGVMVATMTEISFDMTGLISALVSTIGFSLQNIYTKKVLKAVYTVACTFNAKTLEGFKQSDGFTILLLLFVDGALNFAQNLVAFTVLNMVSPLTYSVCNATKRISVITVSLLLLHNPVTPLNVLGMLTAVLGVLCYNKAKYDANKAARKALPLSSHDINPLIRTADQHKLVGAPNGVNGTLHLLSPYNEKLMGL
ncbi:hypothetical protein HPB48_001734 [Haemaphysalis longicornis]|uniref:Sugar phosphate transporter domain-containing protein n=1 Tax=Haemaphysalis longicornis TaxID=44386 RepID=A0A9J6FSV6_HAELO|nr:hypothetical protein HPB48_001734 [Haemaphysalis longicornis]